MLYLFITAFIAGLDEQIKARREQKTEEYDLANGKVHIQTYHNYGACMNLGERIPTGVKLISIMLTLFLTIIFLLTLTRHGKGLLKLGLAILLGGAFSNTYDRMTRGYVVDYLTFPKAPFKLKNVVFNLSDFAITLGALIATLMYKA